MDDPLVSVAMATYNGEKYLRQQLDSIYGQAHKRIEVVVSDDHSTDKTVEILEEYSKGHGLEYTVNEKNIGFVCNFEKVLSRCRGDYIALADQDDLWKPEKIGKLLQEIGGRSLICSDADLMDEHDEVFDESFYELSGYKAVSGRPFRLLVFNNFVTGCTSLCTKALVDQSLPFPAHLLYHDWWLGLVATKLEGIEFIPDRLIRYRQHSLNRIGADKKTGFLEKLREVKAKFADLDFSKEIKSLESMRDAAVFTDGDRKVIDDRIRFFKDILGPPIRFRAFTTALRYHRDLLPNRSPFFKAAFFLGTLFFR